MLVTDDEIVAASVVRDRRWSGVLPSIDMDSADPLTEAASRGARSLIVRGLLTDEATLGADALDLERVVDGAIRVLLYPARESRPLLPIGAAIAVVEAGEFWYLDVTAADGTHDLTSVQDSAAAWAAVRTVLGTAEQLGDDRVLSAVVTRRDAGDAFFVSIRGDEAISAPLSEVGEGDTRLGAGPAADAVAFIQGVLAG